MVKTLTALTLATFLAAIPALADDARPMAGPGAMMGQQCPMGGPGMGFQGMGHHGMGHSMKGMFGGARMASHVDGHIAFLKAELKITPAQEAAWAPFADAVRVSVASKGQGGAAGITGASIDQTFEIKERLQTTRLENTKRLRAAWAKLDGALTDDQRKAATDLMSQHPMIM